jgi:hypothetical protein
MKKIILRVVVLGLLAAVMAGVPSQVLGQDTNKPAAEKKTPPKARAVPFRGKIAAIDKTAKTVTVGARTFAITSETRLFKEDKPATVDKPATLDDAVVGNPVTGNYKIEDGKMVALLLTFLPKADASPKAEDKDKAK